VFPFHQGRFQGRQLDNWDLEYLGFHSTKEGFKGCAELLADLGELLFPFHQGRFQGREEVKPVYTKKTRFHSTKEGFKGSRPCFWSWGTGTVSIPPRKVSRARMGGAGMKKLFPVSIPPRKVSRPDDGRRHLQDAGRFHSTKEGFKATVPPRDTRA